MSHIEPTEDAQHARLRGMFASVADLAQDGERCPPADRLWDSAQGRLPRRENETLILHLPDCGACAAAWRLARALGTEENRGRVPAPRTAWFRRAWLPVAATAALLVVVAGLVAHERYFPREQSSEFRAATHDCIQSLIPEGQPLPRENCALHWSPCPEETTYDIRVTTEDLEAVARARALDRPEFVVPQSSLARVARGGRILWQVTAHVPGGAVYESRSYVTEVE